MSIQRVLANVSCSSLARSRAWYQTLLGSAPARQPMPRLVEWRVTDNADLQLYEEPAKAGHSTVSFVVSAIGAEHARLSTAGLHPGPVEEATGAFLTRLADPDGNLVVVVSDHR